MMASTISYIGMVTVGLHMQGQLHAARRMCQSAIQLGNEVGNQTDAAVGLIYVQQADVLREWNQLDEALELALRGLQFSRQPGYELYLAPAGMTLVRIHLARGDIEAANEALQQLVQTPVIMDNAFNRAWLISVEQVRLWLVGGDFERAFQWAQELEHGERHISSFAREREDVTLQPLLDPLSERELDVLRLLARGASNQEIAKELVVAVNTVKHHVSMILSKLGAGNRTQAVAEARDLGLLSDEP